LAPTRVARTRAVRDGDECRARQKIFTTGGHDADYVWLACCTDPAPAKGYDPHRGRDPGYSWTPIITHDGAHHVNVTYYDGVRVPAAMRVGEENGGWRLITEQLNHERVMLGPAGRLAVLHERVRDWAASRPGPDGRPLAEQPDVRRVLARSYASLRVNELLNWQVAVAERVGIADASATKVYASEQIQRLGQEFEEVVARHGDPADPDTARLSRWLDVQAKRNTVLTFGGGVNEIQRELIASAGLGLPRVPR
jgi:alkylation response protein AidB-like acyl-CoA dehydrogenase